MYGGPAGEGIGFAPGFDLANYATVAGGSFPTENVFLADDNPSPFGDYPEILAPARSFPYGRFDDFQRHKERAFSFWDIGLGKAGASSAGLIYRYDSPLTFSSMVLNFPTSTIQRSRNPGYANVPTTQPLFFGERGSGSFEGAHLFDIALNYDIPVYRTFSPYFKAEVRNVFNEQPLVGFNTMITAVTTPATLDADGLPTTYNPGPNFGKGTQNSHYPVPREFRFSVGFRF